MCLAALNFLPPNEDKTGLLLYRLPRCKPLLQLIDNYQINQPNKQLSTSPRKKKQSFSLLKLKYLQSISTNKSQAFVYANQDFNET